MTVKIIALMPVRNEAWIIERTLRILATFCDHILVADQRSTDGTRQILKKFPKKITVIDNPDVYWSDRIRGRLLDIARGFDGNNFIVYMDADEIVTSNIREDSILDHVVGMKPGNGIRVPLINLWKSPLFYRDDSSNWSNDSVVIGFRDDRTSKYTYRSVGLHQGRIPQNIPSRFFGDVKLLHYQFVLFDRKRSKERWYRVLEALQLGSAHFAAINYSYRQARDEREVRLSPLDPRWTAGWRALGVDLDHFEAEPFYWYDVEVLRYLGERGVAYFAPLDIWDVNWEAKRQLALARGFEGIPQEAIVDPRSREQKLYHAYLARFQHNPFWREPGELLHIADRGLKRLAKGLGLRRHHLEQWGLLKPRGAGGGD